MSRIMSGAALCLFVIIAAIASQSVAADSMPGGSSSGLFGGNRKLLQSSSGTTVFGTPPAGTLVVTWNPIPSKHADNPNYGQVNNPPYQFDWTNVAPITAGVANGSTLFFYPVSAYFVGANGQTTQFKLTSGGCDLTTRTYPDLGTLTNSCVGTFSTPDNSSVAVTQVWDLLQAPDDLQFQVPTPLAQFDCLIFFFGPGLTNETLTNFQATFDTGPIPIQPSTPNTLVTGVFSNIGFSSYPFNDTGTLKFKSINMRVNYGPAPVPISRFDWNWLYAHCVISSLQLTAQNVATPSPAPTAAPTAAPTLAPTTAAPTVAPTTASPTPVDFPVGGVCDPRSSLPNQCFNAPGNRYVCCPGQCPNNPGPNPACGASAPLTPGAQPVGGTCDPTSSKPNQCFNADGSAFVCCPGQCPNTPGASPFCA